MIGTNLFADQSIRYNGYKTIRDVEIINTIISRGPDITPAVNNT